MSVRLKIKIKGFEFCLQQQAKNDFCLSCSPQEDDIEGVHIVAFAEKEDPGKGISPAYSLLTGEIKETENGSLE